VPIEKTIIVEDYAYKVSKALILEYRIPKEFIIDRDKLFTSKY
jgi:hypothetical protein